MALFDVHKAEPGVDVTVSYMRKLKREAPPGAKWVYKTGETNLVGVLVSSATRKTLADYLSEKIWQPFGMEQDASWLLGSTGHEISGCCVQASTRDFARFGLFILGGGMADGKSVLPDGWIKAATMKHADTDQAEYGYGYQWWTYPRGNYGAQGIFGQAITIIPQKRLVIAYIGNWATASGGPERARLMAVSEQIAASID